jgi:hypothetical protein
MYQDFPSEGSIMLTHFEYRNELIPIENWRKLLYRFSPQYLTEIMNQRLYNGKVSVTTCSRCPREYFFRNKFPYALDPDQQAFSFFGTTVHKNLESDDLFSELSMDIDLDVDISGIMDLAFVHNDELIIADYKTWGSYAVQKHKGLVCEEIPMVDKQGQPVLYKNTRKGKYEKGEQRTEKKWIAHEELADNFDVTMQLNMYRIMIELLLRQGKIRFEENPHITKASKLIVYCLIRDGNTFIAKNRGIFSNTESFQLPIIEDKEVIDYHVGKARYIKEQFNAHEFSTLKEILRDPPRIGTPRETLDGYICRETCPVTHLCQLCKTHPPEAERNTLIQDLFNFNTGEIYI